MAERKIVLDLTELLQKNADKVLSGETKLCLTTSSLGIIATSLRKFSDSANEYPSVGGKKLSAQQQAAELQRWREHVKTLYDFVLKVKALKVLHGTNTMRSPVMIARFQSVQVLEIKRLPIHMVEGLSKLRGTLIELRVSKSLQTLMDLLEICGGDRSSGLVWPQLKTLYLSYNSLKQLDTSLRFVPFVEVLDLSHNNLSQTQDFLKCLAELVRVNLGFNMLTSVPEFFGGSRLRTVVLRNNQLDNLQGMEKLSMLEELDVADNLLIEHDKLQPIAGLNRLMVLCVNGNPLSYKTNHRLLTVRQISPLAGVGAFLLDGQRLSQEELAVLKQNRAQVVHQEFPDESQVDNQIAESQLFPSSHTSKKKHGHRRRPSKERIPKIADIEDSLLEEHSSRVTPAVTPGSSYMEDRNVAVEIETMREHLQDNWLKALNVDQTDSVPKVEPVLPKGSNSVKEENYVTQTEQTVNTLNASQMHMGQSVAQTKAISRTTNTSQVQMEVEKTPISQAAKEATQTKEASSVLPKNAVASTVKVTPASPSEFPMKDTTDIYAVSAEKLRKSSQPTTHPDERIVPLVASTVKVTPASPSEFIMKDTTDIYAVPAEKLRKSSQQTTHPDERIVPQFYTQTSTSSTLSDSDVQSTEYDDECDPYIVMVPGEDMKNIIVSLNRRFLLEKDLNGKLLCCLDMNCLLNVIQTEEICHGSDIMSGLQFYVLRLKFDYVRKDFRERAYAMEDSTDAWNLLREFSKHLKSDKSSHIMMQCLKCRTEFQQPQQGDDEEARAIYKCPSCKSTMVIRSDKPPVPPVSPGSSPGDGKNRLNDRPPDMSQKLLAPKNVPKEQSISRFSRRRSPIRSLSPNVGIASARRGSSPNISGRTSPKRDLSPKKEWSPRRGSTPGNGGQSPQRGRSPPRAASPPRLGVSLKDRVDYLIDYKSSKASVTEDTQQSTMSEQTVASTIVVHTSWSDDPPLTSSKYSHQSSVSSVESDITILSKRCSQANLLENETIIENASIVSSDSDIVQLRKSNTIINESIHGIWKTNEQGHITPMGSPLSNSVCSSMVSSVYENTLAGAGDDGPNVHKAQTTDTEEDAIVVRQSRRIRGSPSPSRKNRIAAIYDSDDSDKVQKRKKSVERSDVKETNREYSIYDTDDSHNSSGHSVYNTARSQPDSEHSNNLSVHSDNNNQSSSFSSPLRSNRSRTKSPNQRKLTQSAVDYEQNTSENQVPDFPSDLSPIKQRVQKSDHRSDHRSAFIYDNVSNISENERSVGLSSNISRDSNGDTSFNQSQSQKGSANTTGSGPLPWEIEENKGKASGKDESLNHEEFVNIDHRVQLHLELKVFKGEESAKCAIQCDVVQYMKVAPIKSILVISTHRILLFEITGESTSSDDWLVCYEDQLITELRYIDIGLGYQTLRLEFGTECASYSLLIADEGRCKQFLTLISDILQKVAMSDHSRLEGIIKSSPVTLGNLRAQVIHAPGEEPDPEAEPQELVRYLMVQLVNEDDKGQLLGLVITTTDLVLVEENHQWPLPRLQAPLSESIKGKQFTVKHREKINNIESLMFNEYNPRELRLTFFESSNANSVKAVWLITLETVKGVKSLVDAIRVPWEQEFGVSLDITSTSFSETE
ncbi:hypothetical protein DPMN_056836 [Dreissena polymorpha]|uniref:Serine/threonine-protein kinase 11-interacting protein n=2 Tax=Dreissena polymorpha TaxID=45954 RepID=A0A9D4CV64_DREPO|nr:hypothetical protein DPMN_056836 [Dreissena polymorpha]